MASDDETDSSLTGFINAVVVEAASLLQKTVQDSDIRNQTQMYGTKNGHSSEACTGSCDFNTSGSRSKSRSEQSAEFDVELNSNLRGCEAADDEDFCIVNADGSCDELSSDNSYDMKQSDSMNNLFDHEEANQMDFEVDKDCFYDTVTQLQPGQSNEDVHSDPSSTTLTHVSSSTSNQYRPSEDNESKSISSDIVSVASRLTKYEDNSMVKTTRITTMKEVSDSYFCGPENPESLQKEELVNLVHKLKSVIKEQGEKIIDKEINNKQMVTDDDLNKLCDIIEEQRRYMFVFHCDREQLQDFILKRERESSEVIERLQAECLRLRKQNTMAMENRIRNGLCVSRAMMNCLMKAKYDADKMLADCLNKQTKINELRLVILMQQQQIQDLQVECNNLRCYLETTWDSKDGGNCSDECLPSTQSILNMAEEYPTSGLSQVYNCDNMDQTPATGHSRCPLISTLNAFSVAEHRRRRISSESQRSDKSSVSDVTSGSAYSQTSVSDKETPEEMETYLQECQLTIEKSITDF